ncbi:hypothetical protein [Nonomuraea insulae]|uniref:Uncharacterized protein n=1 Tax=Nonomuraea insulae TaxID=1616787 RepID=A0ABW1CTN6_9ACTN
MSVMRVVAAAELAAMAWTDGRDGFGPRLAPAVRDHVVPLLAGAGVLGAPGVMGAP